MGASGPRANAGGPFSDAGGPAVTRHASCVTRHEAGRGGARRGDDLAWRRGCGAGTPRPQCAHDGEAARMVVPPAFRWRTQRARDRVCSSAFQAVFGFPRRRRKSRVNAELQTRASHRPRDRVCSSAFQAVFGLPRGRRKSRVNAELQTRTSHRRSCRPCGTSRVVGRSPEGAMISPGGEVAGRGRPAHNGLHYRGRPHGGEPVPRGTPAM